MTSAGWQRSCDNGLRWTTIALGFCIPVSVAMDNLLLLVALACWIAGGQFSAKRSAIVRSPVALAALLLFGLLVIGLLWGTSAPGDGPHYVGKYLDLAFVGVFAWAFRDANTRRHAGHALACALGVSLALSLGLASGAVPEWWLLAGTPDYPSAFKLYLTHNILMAYGAFMFANMALRASQPLQRRLYGALAVLATFDVLFLVHGRTGQLILVALLAYGFVVLRGWRGLAMTVITVVALGTAAYQGSASFQMRLDRAAAEYKAWQPDVAAAEVSSLGLRMEFYRNSLSLLRDRPLLGHGTGGFPAAYADKVRDSGMAATSNPHNEYLMIGVQVGIVGLACLVALFVVAWRLARSLPPLECHLARGLVITFAIGSLLNCLLLDHTEGLLFAWMAALVSSARASPAPA